MNSALFAGPIGVGMRVEFEATGNRVAIIRIASQPTSQRAGRRALGSLFSWATRNTVGSTWRTKRDCYAPIKLAGPKAPLCRAQNCNIIIIIIFIFTAFTSDKQDMTNETSPQKAEQRHTLAS